MHRHKGGLISKIIFNLVPSSKNWGCRKSSNNLQLVWKESTQSLHMQTFIQDGFVSLTFDWDIVNFASADEDVRSRREWSAPRAMTTLPNSIRSNPSIVLVTATESMSLNFSLYIKKYRNSDLSHLLWRWNQIKKITSEIKILPPQ